MITLPHLAARLYGTPLLIARAKLDVILAVLGARIGLNARVPAPELALTQHPRPDTRTPGIAVIPVHGTLVRRGLALDAASGLTSYADIAAQLDAALTDPAVSGVLLDLDSPGGESGGVFELAERIRAAAGVKPIWAHANDAAFSAAYALGAAAQRLTLSRTAGVGSIGVIALHVDQSVKDAREGLSYTAITAGAHKNDFNPHQPLSPEAAVALQAEVDRLYALFVEQVAQMRALDPAAVRATEAGLFFGEHAVAVGLADGVKSFDSALAEFGAYLAAQKLPPRAGPRPRGASRSLSLTTESAMNPIDVIQDLPDLPESDAITDPEHAALPPPDAEPTFPEPVPETVLAQARLEAAQEARAIAELCLLAGCPERTTAFLAAGLSEAEVRRALLETRAQQPEIRSTITTEASTASREAQHPEKSPVVAAVRKLHSIHPTAEA